MKVVILAGGYGTRITEETALKPKPMIEIGGKPILWHIMKSYAAHGYKDFVVCLGYKGYVIKEYFSNYFLHMSDVTFDLAKNNMTVHQNSAEDWKVTLVHTGEKTMTGGRLKRVAPYIEDDTFCFTYGDGLADVDLKQVVEFHKKQNDLATLVSVQPPGRFGALELQGDSVKSFHEKPLGDGSWVNGGFFVLSKKVFDYVDGDDTVWEKKPLETLAAEGKVSAYKHAGFWKPMDTLRDKIYLEELWASGQAPWKIWKN